MNIQWFPGHMTKTIKEIKENLALADFVIELLDARIPYSSGNPELARILPDKKRITVLNKSDLAHPEATARWIEHFKNRSITALAIDSLSGSGVRELMLKITERGEMVREKWQKRGRKNKRIRVMIAGIPNVGKSSLINRIAGKASARTGDKPGVTRGRQWVKVAEGIDLLDTPGVLWPKFDEERVGVNLAITGAIKEEVLDREELALKLIERLFQLDPELLKRGYGIVQLEETPYRVLEQVGSARGCMVRGGRIDTLRTSIILLEDFRSGRLGRITLELPEDAP
ncbi:MAG: ribosome biogenesis GTPase YlqF [Clostridiales bacterium]|jgi:ribosome biogenesis GTPase A|nr:ribosome biogenesis GTPase YlqF [Clostridiales bacterium]